MCIYPVCAGSSLQRADPLLEDCVKDQETEEVTKVQQKGCRAIDKYSVWSSLKSLIKLYCSEGVTHAFVNMLNFFVKTSYRQALPNIM
jgi:hypothetical protein